VPDPREGHAAETVEVRTARLRLSPVDASGPEERAALAACWGDPRTWAHLPSGCPTDDAWVEPWIAGHVRSRARTGLGWWLVRLVGPVGSVPVGTIVGAGGCALIEGLAAWNLGYRLTPDVWGYGVATELAVAGLQAAREADPGLPVTARVLERNPASWHVLEKVGLTLVWSGVISGGDAMTAGLCRRIYADRPLSADLLAGLIALEQVDRRR